jgi:hypothetical protein
MSLRQMDRQECLPHHNNPDRRLSLRGNDIRKASFREGTSGNSRLLLTVRNKTKRDRK